MDNLSGFANGLAVVLSVGLGWLVVRRWPWALLPAAISAALFLVPSLVVFSRKLTGHSLLLPLLAVFVLGGVAQVPGLPLRVALACVVLPFAVQGVVMLVMLLRFFVTG